MPIEPPICCVVLTIADATPLSWRGTPRVAVAAALVSAIGPTASMPYAAHSPAEMLSMFDVLIDVGGRDRWEGDGEPRYSFHPLDDVPFIAQQLPAIQLGAFGLVIILFLIFEPRGHFGSWLRIRNYWKAYPFSY